MVEEVSTQEWRQKKWQHHFYVVITNLPLDKTISFGDSNIDDRRELNEVPYCI
jgi:hypothetical protein